METRANNVLRYQGKVIANLVNTPEGTKVVPTVTRDIAKQLIRKLPLDERLELSEVAPPLLELVREYQICLEECTTLGEIGLYLYDGRMNVKYLKKYERKVYDMILKKGLIFVCDPYYSGIKHGHA